MFTGQQTGSSGDFDSVLKHIMQQGLCSTIVVFLHSKNHFYAITPELSQLRT